MNRIWANRIEDGSRWTWADVPESRKNAVRAILREDTENGRNGMTPERYEEITGEDYVDV